MGRSAGVARAICSLAAVAALAAGCSTLSGASEPTAPAPAAASAAGPHPARAVRPNPCAANAHGKQIIVSIAAQRVWLCSARRVAFTSAVTTGRAGRATATPTGDFRIDARLRDVTLRPDTGGSYPVRYWVAFEAPAYGFHDASWQHFPYGSPRYRSDGSHGCVHLPLRAMAVLYRWARIGTRVHLS